MVTCRTDGNTTEEVADSNNDRKVDSDPARYCWPVTTTCGNAVFDRHEVQQATIDTLDGFGAKCRLSPTSVLHATDGINAREFQPVYNLFSDVVPEPRTKVPCTKWD